jgi:hypothetical protein
MKVLFQRWNAILFYDGSFLNLHMQPVMGSPNLYLTHNTKM